MKTRISIVAAAALVALASCAQLQYNEIAEENSNIMSFTLYGWFPADPNATYNAVVDTVENTAIIQVPYYLSDTEPIQGNLTEMKIRANLPQGAKISPSLAGTYNMIDGLDATITYASGAKADWHISAAYYKSKACDLKSLRVTTTGVMATIIVSPPEKEGDNGTIRVTQTVKNAKALEDCVMALSPWATAEGECVTFDAESGSYHANLVSEKDITVVAQDGKTKTTYKVMLTVEEPQPIEYGISTISLAYAFQCTVENPHGFERDANFTIAYADRTYLVITNKNDFNKMIVLDGMSGVEAGVKVNVSGIPTDREIRAITTDDAGHLVAVTYTSKLDQTDTFVAVGRDTYATPKEFLVYVWKDGITAAPTLIASKSIILDDFKACSPVPSEIGNSITVKGDLTTGDALLLTHDMAVGREYFLFFKDGEYQSLKVFCPNNSGSLAWTSRWVAANAAITDVKFDQRTVEYYYATGMENQGVYCVKPTSFYQFTVPTTNWWAGSSQYDHAILGMDFMNFNGANIMAVQNGYVSNSIWSFRLYLSDITANPDKDSFKNGFLFDTRENNDSPYIVDGTGYGISGMTSYYPFESGLTPIGTDNYQKKRGDVVFGRTSDPNIVMMIMMTMNSGVIAYQLSSYEI